MFAFSTLNTFRNDRSASTSIVLSLSLLPLMAFTGAAIDFGLAVQKKTLVQYASDTVALDLAKLYSAGSLQSPSSAELTASARTKFQAVLAGHALEVANVTADFNSATGRMATIVEVAAEPVMVSILGVNHIRITVSSTAQANKNDYPACLLALETTLPGITLDGSGRLAATNCAIHANSTSNAALLASNNSTVTAPAVSLVGRYVMTSVPNPPPMVGQAAKADPLASLAQPGANLKPVGRNCTYTGRIISTPTTFNDGDMFCGNTRINAAATFRPGTYYFYSGNVSVGSTGSVVGDRVLWFFGENVPFTSQGNGNVKLTPPDSGTYKGITIFGARWSGTPADFIFTANRDFSINGTIYLPSHNLKYYGDADMTVSSDSGMIIAKQLYFAGSSSLSVSRTGTVSDMLTNWKFSTSGAVRLVK